MRQIIKRITRIFTIIVILILILILISFINHRINLKREAKLFIPTGKMVTVNNHLIHIYAEGKGKTLVFMSGGGTSAPALDFKSLYTLMSDEYRIAVVEKAGYGFSEISNVSRDVDTILEETREALANAGETGPYVLFPHSMSGIEALYWAQKYPNEVSAIIGLDPAVPAFYEGLEINTSELKVLSAAANLGVARWISSICDSSTAIQHGALSDEEKELYRAIFYRRTLTKPMLNEIRCIKESAKKVEKGGIPNIPMLFFGSNGEGTGWSQEQWKAILQDYISDTENGEYVELNCSHYIHNIEYEIIEERSKIFLDKVLSN